MLKLTFNLPLPLTYGYFSTREMAGLDAAQTGVGISSVNSASCPFYMSCVTGTRIQHNPNKVCR